MNKKIVFIVMFLALIFVAIQPVAAMPKQVVTVPTPLTPSGIIRDITPTFTWSKIMEATDYKLQLFKKGSSVYVVTVTKDSCYSDLKCSTTPRYIIGPGTYTWKVQAKVGGFWKSFSFSRAFTFATVPNTRNPTGTISITSPQFSFSEIVGATQYQIELKKGRTFIKTIILSDGFCDEFGYCQIIPNFFLAKGTYAWRIRSFVEGAWKGFSPWHEFKLVDHVTVYVPADTFQMGCDPLHNAGYSCNYEETPLHLVYLSSFWIDKYEVTNSQYAECVADYGCRTPQDYSSNYRGSYYGNPTYANYPVIYVTWYQASNYCSWTGGRLPTEAEWEKAARGRNPQAYPWGDSPADCSMANSGSCEGDTTQAGNYPLGASKYGAMDMAGNVSEWVGDWYDEGYYWSSPTDNPVGPANGNDRVTRGYSWNFENSYVRTASRGGAPEDANANDLGFRCVYSN